MKRFVGFVLATAAALGCHSGIAASRATCMEADKAGGWISGGLLTQRTYKDAAGRPELAYILTMPQAECLNGQKRIRRFVGKRVMVEGRAFGAATAQHHAPIVVDLSSIDLP